MPGLGKARPSICKGHPPPNMATTVGSTSSSGTSSSPQLPPAAGDLISQLVGMGSPAFKDPSKLEKVPRERAKLASRV
jgi:hypothetical protein